MTATRSATRAYRPGYAAVNCTPSDYAKQACRAVCAGGISGRCAACLPCVPLPLYSLARTLAWVSEAWNWRASPHRPAPPPPTPSGRARNLTAGGSDGRNAHRYGHRFIRAYILFGLNTSWVQNNTALIVLGTGFLRYLTLRAVPPPALIW